MKEKTEIETSKRIEQIFSDLNDLIKTGQFTRDELDFMETFLTISLNGTKRVIARTKEKEKEKDQG